MSLLPIVLFILGILVLIWAMRMGNSTSTPSPEILATLKGLASVKRELNQVQRGLSNTEDRMEDHELRILRNENSQAEIRNVLEESKSQGASVAQTLNRKERLTGEPQRLSEKYRQVLELSRQGWAEAEIARHLGISQDAVYMVLRTFQRGGQL